jgi:hypothetical protein
MTIFEKPLPPTPVLQTERLILRPLVPADAGHPAPLPALGGRAAEHRSRRSKAR